MPDWISTSIAIASAMAAIASAVFAQKTYNQSKKLSIRDLRMEAENLNRALNEKIDLIRTIHKTRLNNLKSMANLSGNLRSGSVKAHEAEWLKDGDRLEAAIGTLDTPQRTYGDLNEDELEAKLLNLQSIEREYVRELELGKDWEADNDRIREWVMATSKRDQ